MQMRGIYTTKKTQKKYGRAKYKKWRREKRKKMRKYQWTLFATSSLIASSQSTTLYFSWATCRARKASRETTLACAGKSGTSQGPVSLYCIYQLRESLCVWYKKRF